MKVLFITLFTFFISFQNMKAEVEGTTKLRLNNTESVIIKIKKNTERNGITFYDLEIRYQIKKDIKQNLILSDFFDSDQIVLVEIKASVYDKKRKVFTIVTEHQSSLKAFPSSYKQVSVFMIKDNKIILRLKKFDFENKRIELENYAVDKPKAKIVEEIYSYAGVDFTKEKITISGVTKKYSEQGSKISNLKKEIVNKTIELKGVK